MEPIINDTMLKVSEERLKPKIRWLGGLCLLLFLVAFYSSSFSYYFFDTLGLPSIFELPLESASFFENVKEYILDIDEIEVELFLYVFLLIFPVILFLISTYKTEKTIIRNHSFKNLLIRNIIVVFIIYGIVFFPFIFLPSLSLLNGVGLSIDFLNPLIKNELFQGAFFFSHYFKYFLAVIIPLSVVFFSIIPALFLYKFYTDKKIIFVSFFTFVFLTIGMFLIQFRYHNTCGDYMYPVCLGEKASAEKNPLLCEKSKDDYDDEPFSARDHCYLELSYKWNDIKICDNFSDNDSKNRCVINIAVNNKNQAFCDLIQNKIDKSECLSNFIPSVGGCDLTDYYCVSKKVIKWKDYSLCEQLISEEKKNYCYDSASYGWKDINICRQISGNDNKAKNTMYSCVTNVAINSKNETLCKELNSGYEKWCMQRYSKEYNKKEVSQF